MTLFHFGNCFALAYFPYFITYKCSGLSEYSAFWRCVQAGATYVLVQLGKMLFLATFFPTWEGPSGGYDLVGVSFWGTPKKGGEGWGGCKGVQGSRRCWECPGGGDLKGFWVGFGWVSGPPLTPPHLPRCVPLWVGARGVEFDWRHLQMGLDSNISLV
ncbi:TM147 protein, partial [Neopipo cinnamomea]|nr:TM147 protein [Neopipo cinnamomea]